MHLTIAVWGFHNYSDWPTDWALHCLLIHPCAACDNLASLICVAVQQWYGVSLLLLWVQKVWLHMPGIDRATGSDGAPPMLISSKYFVSWVWVMWQEARPNVCIFINLSLTNCQQVVAHLQESNYFCVQMCCSLPTQHMCCTNLFIDHNFAEIKKKNMSMTLWTRLHQTFAKLHWLAHNDFVKEKWLKMYLLLTCWNCRIHREDIFVAIN